MNYFTKQALILIFVIMLYIIISVGLSLYFYSLANPTLKQAGYLALSYGLIFPVINFTITVIKKMIKGDY